MTIYAKATTGSWQGTGFVIDSKGLVATAYHVIQGATHLEVRDNAFETLENVTVEHIDTRRDIAILRVLGAQQLPALRLSATPPPAFGEIKISGSPRGLLKQVLFGRLSGPGSVSSLAMSSESGKAIFAEDIQVLPIDVTVYGGMSGGPVMTSNGDVIGLLSGSWNGGRGIAWVIPSRYISDALATASIGRRAEDMKNWEHLSLMRAGWVSLNRSYGKVYTPEHIAKLEILEESFKGLRGAWTSHADVVTATDLVFARYPAVMNGLCQAVTYVGQRLQINTLDQSNVEISGSVVTTLRKEARFTDDNGVVSSNRICAESVTKAEVTLKGTLSAYVEDVGDFSARDAAFATEVRITECNGQCSAEAYGKHDGDPLEWISETALRMGPLILYRQ